MLVHGRWPSRRVFVAVGELDRLDKQRLGHLGPRRRLGAEERRRARPRRPSRLRGGRRGRVVLARQPRLRIARLQPVGAPRVKASDGGRLRARARAEEARALSGVLKEAGVGGGCGERETAGARTCFSVAYPCARRARTSSAFASWTPRAEPSAIRLMSSFSTSSARSVISSARRALSVPASSPTRSKLPPPEKHESHMERGCAARDPHVVDKPLTIRTF